MDDWVLVDFKQLPVTPQNNLHKLYLLRLTSRLLPMLEVCINTVVRSIDCDLLNTLCIKATSVGPLFVFAVYCRLGDSFVAPQSI